MSDLVVFVGIVALVVVVGVLVGIIVAGRIDRILAPPPAPPATGPEAEPGTIDRRPDAEKEEHP